MMNRSHGCFLDLAFERSDVLADLVDLSFTGVPFYSFLKRFESLFAQLLESAFESIELKLKLHEFFFFHLNEVLVADVILERRQREREFFLNDLFALSPPRKYSWLLWIRAFAFTDRSISRVADRP
jgi:hypothetical protein